MGTRHSDAARGLSCAGTHANSASILASRDIETANNSSA
jgi:hypothetical protein